MNCRDIEPLLLAERDGVLTPEEHAALAKHVAACPACRHARAAYGEAVTFLKTDAANVKVPNVAEAWWAVQAEIRAGSMPAKKKRPLAPVIWFAAPMAAAAALAVMFLSDRSYSTTETPVANVSPAGPESRTIAYVDKDSGWLVVWAGDANKSG